MVAERTRVATDRTSCRATYDAIDVVTAHNTIFRATEGATYRAVNMATRDATDSATKAAAKLALETFNRKEKP